MRKAPLTQPPSAFPEAALPVAMHHAALMSCRTISTHRSTCATTQSSKIQKSTTHGGGEAFKLKARPNSLLCRRARASSNANPLWTAVPLPSGDMSLAVATCGPAGHRAGTRGAPCPLPAPTLARSRREQFCAPLPAGTQG